jgi:hypothetical protein|tara:strand:+ start:34 stop:240 length:207 start_codon:yes stop_codon:yes gene_type:complete
VDLGLVGDCPEDVEELLEGVHAHLVSMLFKLLYLLSFNLLIFREVFLTPGFQNDLHSLTEGVIAFYLS